MGLGRGLSLLERLVCLPGGRRAAVLERVPPRRRRRLLTDWRMLARPEQLPPPGDWAVWLILAGRGFGKTRAGAEWVTARARAHAGARIALVGATAQDALAVMLDGESGLKAVAPAGFRPEWRPSRRQLIWPNGSQAMLLSADEPDRLRGPQFHFAWGDELAAWAKPKAAFDNLRLGLRLGERPRMVVTTTPRPLPFLKALAGAPDTVVTRGSTFDNRANLPPAFLADMTAAYAGTALGRQEMMGELLDAREGALWSRDLLDGVREAEAPELVRVVVAVDPPAGPGGCGIVVAGLDGQGLAHVLADASLVDAAPETWAKAVVAAFHRHAADRIIVETNNGGAMVPAMLRAVGANLPIRDVRASRGKSARAEPVAALYARGRVRHAGLFAELEDELCGLMAGGGYVGPGTSPDRADALVWALTELMLADGQRAPGIRVLGAG